METGVSREKHIEIMEAMGLSIEDSEEDMPIDFSDLCVETQQALEVHRYFPDRWTDSGIYLGKDLSIVESVLRCYGITDKATKLYTISVINIIDRHLSNKTSEKMKSELKKHRSK